MVVYIKSYYCSLTVFYQKDIVNLKVRTVEGQGYVML